MGTDNERQEYLDKIKEFRPFDDTFMRVLFRVSPKAAQKTIQIITKNDSLKIVKNKTQYDLTRLGGARGICLDVLAVDDEKVNYDLEVQRDSRGASIRRLRYHGSALDVENLDEKQDFDELPNVYIIFITEKDTFGDGFPIHEMILCDTATGKLNDDGKHLLYVNGEYKGNDAIGDLMHDFNCRNADEMRIPEIADGTRYLKNTKEGQNEMCDIMQGLVDENTEKVIINMIQNQHKSTGRSYEQIMNEMMLSDADKKKYLAILNKDADKVSVG